jgi:hypothetical protein
MEWILFGRVSRIRESGGKEGWINHREERVCTYIIARLHGRMGLHPSSFVVFYLKGTVSREEWAYFVRLHDWMGLHSSSFVAFYIKGAVSREERASILYISLQDCMDGWRYIIVAL